MKPKQKSIPEEMKELKENIKMHASGLHRTQWRYMVEHLDQTTEKLESTFPQKPEPKIEYRSKGFKRYNNKVLPKYECETWVVWRDSEHGIAFRKYEEAVLFREILVVKSLLGGKS